MYMQKDHGRSKMSGRKYGGDTSSVKKVMMEQNSGTKSSGESQV